MAVTQSQSKAPGSVSNVATGSYLTSDAAAAITVTCGFKPRYVLVVNQTSGDRYEWFYGMTAAHAVKRVAAGTWSAITSLGVTVAEHGFTIGLDTDVNVINEQIRWLAIG